jgi:hypothetical protein
MLFARGVLSMSCLAERALNGPSGGSWYLPEITVRWLVGAQEVPQINVVNGLRGKHARLAPLNAKGFSG